MMSSSPKDQALANNATLTEVEPEQARASNNDDEMTEQERSIADRKAREKEAQEQAGMRRWSCLTLNSPSPTIQMEANYSRRRHHHLCSKGNAWSGHDCCDRTQEAKGFPQRAGAYHGGTCFLLYS